MHKKLTTILLAVLIILIGKVDAATLTQKIGEGYIRSTVVEGQEVTIKFVSSKYTFSSWTVESGNISIDTTNPVVTFTMPSSNVVIKANYEGDTQSNITLSSAVNVGDYVKYVPSSTSYTVPTTVSGYTSDQNFNPSSTTSWRVFSNDGTNVEIISTDSVGDLSLRGSTGYINAVQTLQDMSAAYVNPLYATSGRSLGYSESGLTSTQIANYKTLDTATYPLEHGRGSTFPYKDSQYTADGTVLSNHGSMYHSSGFVWFASRECALTTSGTIQFRNFTVRIMNSSNIGGYDYYGLSKVYSDDSVGSENISHGVRPVVSLKSGLAITGGSGTSADPYIITNTTTSQYTITYCANGGYGDMNPQSIAQGSSVILTTNAYEHHSKTFVGWATSATGSVVYTDGANITPTSDMTLYAVWEEVTLLSDVTTVGDYVKYVPSNTSYTVSSSVSGYTSDQTYNPSNTTSWRVFSNDGTNVEIISADSVGDLYLRGSTGYVNAVQTLQDMSSAYVNPLYATSGRSLGYSESGLTSTQIANYKTIDTATYPIEYGISSTFPYYDSQYTTDSTVLTNHGSMYHSSGYVWLASRDAEPSTGSYYSSFYMRLMGASGMVSSGSLYLVYSGTVRTDAGAWGVRPIVTLKSGLTITGGSGTSTDPYIISAQ